MPTWVNVQQDTVENMMQELQNRMAWIMSRLDSKNIREIDANKVTVKNLVVGENVQMGPDAYISWSNVSNKPNISQTALDAINSTYIDSYGVWTPHVYATNISTLYGKITSAQIDTLTANQITSGTMVADRISGGNLSGVTINAGYKLYINGADFGSGISWNNSHNEINIDNMSYSMYLKADSLYHNDGTGNYPLAKCGNDQKLKFQVYGGYLEVYDGSTYKGRMLLT